MKNISIALNVEIVNCYMEIIFIFVHVKKIYAHYVFLNMVNILKYFLIINIFNAIIMELIIYHIVKYVKKIYVKLVNQSILSNILNIKLLFIRKKF